MKIFFIISILVILGNATSKHLPPFIKKCSKSDPNFTACFDSSAETAIKMLENGNQDMGLSSLNPFVIEKLDLGNITSGPVSLHQVYTNVKIFGISNTKMRNVDTNFESCNWHFNSFTPEVRMEADYTMKGSLMIFSINGHGKCNHTLYDVATEQKIKCERYTKKNKTYLRVTEFFFNMKPGKFVIGFDNLIEGNEQLGQEVVRALNENADSLYEEVGPAFSEMMAIVWKRSINELFSRVPEDELFLP